MEETNEKAYTEVVELLKFFPKESVEKIPKEEIDLYIENRDKTYIYNVDESKSFDEQKMLMKTKAIFSNIFRDYWATDYQRERIIAKENADRAIIEKEKEEKYDVYKVFEQRQQLNENNKDKNECNELQIKVENNFFSKLKKFLYKIKTKYNKDR